MSKDDKGTMFGDRKILMHPIVFIIIIILFSADPLYANMTEVCDATLSGITAQAGINMNIGDSRVIITADSIAYSDTDSTPHNWIEFNNVTITGPDGYFKLDCPQDYPVTMDIDTLTTIDGQNRTLMLMQLSTHVNPRTWEVGNFVFAGQDLGSLLVDSCTVDPSYLSISSHLESGTQGIDYEYLTKWQTERFSYTYNNLGDSLTVSNIYLAGQASGASDDPSNPSTWEFSGPFRIGDILGGNIDTDGDPLNQASSNAATCDVATVDGTTSIYLNIPMKGTFRAKAVDFGGNGYGPIAIDGITTHYLHVRFNPGD